MPFDRIIAEVPELFVLNLSECMLPCGFEAIYRLMLVCRRTRDLVMSAKQLWLRCALLSTGYPTIDVDPRSPDFFKLIRLTIFPWESKPSVLHLRVPALTNLTITRRLALVEPDRLAFVSEIEDGPSEIIGFPSRPCAPEDFIIEPVSRPAFDGTLVLPGAQRILRGGVIPSFVYGGFAYHRIHDGAFAIAAIFPRHSDERVCNGIYFFVERAGKNALFHTHHSGPELCGLVHFSSMVSRPGEIWLATNDRLIYFGPHSHSSCRACETFVSWDDEEFWDVYFGRQQRRVTNHTVYGRSPILQRTAVHYAVYGCRVDPLKRVLDARADPNERDVCGVSPLQVATQMCFVPGIEVLVGAGAEGVQEMLHFVSGDDNDAIMVRMLLDLGADPNAVDRNGCSPLHRPHFLADARLLTLLCARGANPRLCDAGDLGLTPLHWAVCYRIKPACVALVREHGCDINCVSARYGVTPLMSAVGRGWYEGVQMLVDEFGADIDARDVTGLRAVDMAQTERIVWFLEKAARRV